MWDKRLTTYEPFDDWVATRTTLHLYLQIVGKSLLELIPRRNHWWHATFKLTPRGLVSDPFVTNGTLHQFRFDLQGAAFAIDGEQQVCRQFELSDGLTVAAFYRAFHELAAQLGIPITIRRPVPYDHVVETPFGEDETHSRLDPRWLKTYWDTLVHSALVLERFANGFSVKRSPVQLFWHAMDLAVSYYSGRSLPPVEGMNESSRDAFSHETGGVGFKAGDEIFGFPFYFGYLYPSDERVMECPLVPDGAYWSTDGGFIRAILPQEALLATANPDATLLDFFDATYRGPAAQLGWPVSDMAYTT